MPTSSMVESSIVSQDCQILCEQSCTKRDTNGLSNNDVENVEHGCSSKLELIMTCVVLWPKYKYPL